MIHPKLARFIDLAKAEKIYRELISCDISDMSPSDSSYIKGATDAVLAIIGVNTKITKVLNIVPEMTNEERNQLLKEMMRKSNPDAIEIYSKEEAMYDGLSTN
jgi:hypothetical protein